MTWALPMSYSRIHFGELAHRTNTNPTYNKYNPWIYRDEEQGAVVLMFEREPTAEEKTVLRVLFSDWLL